MSNKEMVEQLKKANLPVKLTNDNKIIIGKDTNNKSK